MKRIDVDPPYCGAGEAPVADSGRAFVAGISGSSPGDASIRAIDVAAERVAWTATFPSSDYARDLATSLPLPRADGGAWLAVHQFDGGVVVNGVSGAGRSDARIELPDEYPLSGAFDSGSKVMLRLMRTRDDGVLVAWTYRQVRKHGLTSYAIDGTAIWSAPEWLLACDRSVAITCPVPDRQSKSRSLFPTYPMTMVARNVHDGALLWQADVHDASVAALVDGTVYLADRSDALRDARAQEAAIEAAFLDGRLTEAALEAAFARALPRVPTRVRAIDATTGRERWVLDAGAQVLGVVAGACGVAVLSHELDGSLHVCCASLEGSRVADTMLESRSSCDPRRMPADTAAMLSDGDSLVVLTAERWMSLRFDGVVRSSGPLPAACFGFEPRTIDRWLTLPSAILVDGRLVLRAERSVWIVIAD